MNITYSQHPLTTVSPFCAVPFSPVDLIYNPQCYQDTLTDTIQVVIDVYVNANIIITQLIVSAIRTYWIYALWGALFTSIIILCMKSICSEEPDEQLTHTEEHVLQYIQMNASTGCTVSMIHRHIDTALSIDTIRHTLHSLKRKGMIIPMSTTLWIISGN